MHRTAVTLAALTLLSLCGLSARAQTVSRKIYEVADPKAEALQQLLAKAQAEMNQQSYAAAANDLQRYLAAEPNDAVAHFQLGYAYTALKKTDEARAEYEKAADLNPKMAAAHLNLGLTLLDTDPAAAIAPLRKAVALQPDEARPAYLLGWALERTGKRDEAIQEYEAAEKLDSKNFDVHFALGRTLLASNQPAEAAPEFNAALDLQPQSGPAHLGLAQCLIAQGKRQDAAAQLRMYLETAPTDGETRVQYASLLQDLGKSADALAQLQSVTGTDQAAIDAGKLRARIYEDQKNYGAASAALAVVVQMAPQDAGAHAQLGRLDMRLKNYDAAISELGQALRLNPKDGSILQDMAATYLLGGDYGATLNVLAEIEKRGLLTPREWYVRGLCFDKLGDVSAAVAAYQKFLALNNGAENDEYFEASARARELERELKNKNQ